MRFEVLIIYLLIIVASSVVHEFVHGYVAYLLGDDTAKVKGRLSFNPLTHIDPFLSIILPMIIVVTNMFTGINAPVFGGAKPVPFNPGRLRGREWGAAAVAAAGPVSNLLMAFIYVGLLTISGGGLLATISYIGIMVNMGFFAFNIIPIPPLDGSRILFAFAPESVRHFMIRIERYGLLFVFLLVVFFGGVLGGFIITVTNFFLSVFIGIFG